ncbi:MAG: GNAT family N-acetyltransferase [Thioalkalispiraceae bacterium]|jgi:predicted N-acetyltransferase YhbS
MQYRIEPIARRPELIPVLAQWHDQEWRHLNPAHYDLQARIAEYQQATTSSPLPVMLVAHQQGAAMGSARLIADDMETHPELSPWLASLYVHPDYRQQGVATRLINEIELSANRLGFEQIYLFTEDKAQLYKRLDWQEYAHDVYFGQSVMIMKKALN